MCLPAFHIIISSNKKILETHLMGNYNFD